VRSLVVLLFVMPAVVGHSSEKNPVRFSLTQRALEMVEDSLARVGSEDEIQKHHLKKIRDFISERLTRPKGLGHMFPDGIAFLEVDLSEEHPGLVFKLTGDRDETFSRKEVELDDVYAAACFCFRALNRESKPERQVPSFLQHLFYTARLQKKIEADDDHPCSSTVRFSTIGGNR